MARNLKKTSAFTKAADPTRSFVCGHLLPLFTFHLSIRFRSSPPPFYSIDHQAHALSYLLY